MAFGRAKQTLSLKRQIHAVPIRTRHVEIVETDDGAEITVELKYEGLPAVAARVLKARRKKMFLLEGVGYGVYCAVDGRRTVEDLIDDFAERHKLTFFEARAFLAQYLQTLMKNGLIVMGVQEEAD